MDNGLADYIKTEPEVDLTEYTTISSSSSSSRSSRTPTSEYNFCSLLEPQIDLNEEEQHLQQQQQGTRNRELNFDDLTNMTKADSDFKMLVQHLNGQSNDNAVVTVVPGGRLLGQKRCRYKAKSNAEMMREYRRRRKNDPIKYQEYLERERQRNKKRKRITGNRRYKPNVELMEIKSPLRLDETTEEKREVLRMNGVELSVVSKNQANSSVSTAPAKNESKKRRPPEIDIVPREKRLYTIEDLFEDLEKVATKTTSSLADSRRTDPDPPQPPAAVPTTFSNSAIRSGRSNNVATSKLPPLKYYPATRHPAKDQSQIVNNTPATTATMPTLYVLPKNTRNSPRKPGPKSRMSLPNKLTELNDLLTEQAAVIANNARTVFVPEANIVTRPNRAARSRQSLIAKNVQSVETAITLQPLPPDFNLIRSTVPVVNNSKKTVPNRKSSIPSVISPVPVEVDEPNEIEIVVPKPVVVDLTDDLSDNDEDIERDNKKQSPPPPSLDETELVAPNKTETIESDDAQQQIVKTTLNKADAVPTVSTTTTTTTTTTPTLPNNIKLPPMQNKTKPNYFDSFLGFVTEKYKDEKRSAVKVNISSEQTTQIFNSRLRTRKPRT